MNLEQLKDQWQQDLIQPGFSMQDDLMKQVEDNMSKLDKQIQLRSIFGVLSFSMVLIFMAGLNYFLYLNNMSIVAIVGMSLWMVVFAISNILLLKIKQASKEENELPIEQSLRHKLSRVDTEISFYATLIWWLLAPLGIGMILVLVGIGANLSTGSLFIGFFVFLMYLAHSNNNKTINKHLQPVRAELCQALDELVEK